MLKFFLYFLLSFIALSIDAQLQRVLPGRIVGGTEVDKHEFPFIIDLRRGFHYCGGSIITPEWIVTAAHCLAGKEDEYTVVAGDHNIWLNEGTEQRRNVSKIIKHPRYTELLQSNDVALIKLSEPLDFNQYVQPIVMAEESFNAVSRGFATAIGWGSLEENGDSPDELRKVTVPTVTDSACRTAYFPLTITDTMLCAGESGKDSCQGDSGGPLICHSPIDDDYDRMILCGVVSWGVGCARPRYPGVYTEISYFNAWIIDQINHST